MAGFSKRAVARPDQGSLQDYCIRLGINYAAVAQNQDAGFQREAHDMMQALTGLAYAEPNVTKNWKNRVTWHVVNDPRYNYPFWTKLDRVKEEVFGPGWSPHFDEGDLIAHPWCLSPDDFKRTYEALLDEQFPLGLPQQRATSAAAFDWLFGFLGAGAAGTAITPGLEPVAPFLGVAGAGAWGIGKLAAIAQDGQLKSKLNALRVKIPDLVQAYRMEASYRAKAFGQAPSSPTLTSSNSIVRLGL